MRPHALRVLSLTLVALPVWGCGQTERLPAPRVELESLAIDTEAPMVVVGETIELSVVGSYSDGTMKTLEGGVTWTSSDPTVARHVTGGSFAGVSTGEVQIEATTSDLSATARLTVLPSPVVLLQLEPSSLTIEEGKSRAFTAFAVLADSSRVDVTDSATWSSSDTSIVGIAAGLATARSPGTADIIARVEGDISDTAQVTVTPAPLVSLDLGGASRTVPLGMTLQLEAVGVFSSGSTVAMTADLQWSSNNEAIVTVGNTAGTKGLVSTRSEGQTTVTAEHPATGVRAVVTVRVTGAELTALRVAPANSTIGAGQRAYLAAQAVLSDGSVMNVTRDVRWQSSNPSVATAFDTAFERGEVLGNAAGQATISVQDPASGISSEDSGGSATVTVTPPTVQSITVDPPSSAVAAGLTTPFRAFANLSNGSSQEVTTQVTWRTSDLQVATIDAAGVATGVLAGSVTVSARDPVTGVDSGAAGSAQLTVQPPILNALTVTPPTAALGPNDTLQLTATGQFSDGTTPDISANVQWTSSNPTVASVAAGGLVTALQVGMATITARHAQTGLTSTSVLTIVPPQLIDLEVTPTPVAGPLGVSIQLTATGTYNTSSVIDLTNVVEWTSSNPSVAAVPMSGADAGLVSLLAQGTATISVREPSSGLTSDTTGGSATVTVDPTITLTSLAVTAPATTVLVGSTTQLTAVGTFSNMATFEVTDAVTFSSSNTAVATISNVAGSRGQMSALSVGTTVPSATHTASGVTSTNDPTINVFVQSAVTFDFTGQVQTWTVPQGVNSVEIDASGAAGGNGSNGGVGGLGARIVGTVPVTPGENLTVIVGGAGGNGTGTIAGGGGGGGSFVLRGTTPLVIAGGGGGASYQAPGNTHGQGGLTTQIGGPGGYSVVPAGQGGFTDNGGGGGTGGGGGGLNGAGTGNNWVTGGQAAGGQGGTGVYNNQGGFGGGGGSMHGGGGGGGYTGGSGGTYTIGAGGGGSFNAGTNQTAQAGVRPGNGQIILRPQP